MISEKVAKEFETYFARHLPILLKKSGLDLKIVSIGGDYNEEGILMRVAAIPKDAAKDSLNKFLIDRNQEDMVVKAEKPKREGKRFDLKRVGLSSEKLRELEAALSHKYTAGTIYVGKKGSYALIGFSVKRDAYVMYGIETSERLIVDKDKFKKLKKM